MNDEQYYYRNITPQSIDFYAFAVPQE